MNYALLIAMKHLIFRFLCCRSALLHDSEQARARARPMRISCSAQKKIEKFTELVVVEEIGSRMACMGRVWTCEDPLAKKEK